MSSNSFKSYGGIQNHVMGLYSYLKSKGHYVKIISPKFKNEKEINQDHILLGKSIKLNVNGSMTDIVTFGKNDNIKKLLEKENFDIIHIHNPGIIISIHFLKNSSTKNIITFHLLPDNSNMYKILKSPLNRLKKTNIYNKINGIIFVSNPVKKYFSRYFRCKKEVIPNGIDLSKYCSEDKIDKYVDGKKNILFVGRIEERKGLIYLIKAFEILKKTNKNIRLIVVGEGNLEKSCKNYVKKKKIEDVEFVGSVSEEDKVKYFNTCDIFCAPSIFGESFGIVLLEAMAKGKPITGFANNGYKNLLKGKMKKFLAKPKNYSSLAKKIKILLKNEELRKELGEYGKEEVKKYSWDIVGEQIENFYKRILNEK